MEGGGEGRTKAGRERDTEEEVEGKGWWKEGREPKWLYKIAGERHRGPDTSFHGAWDRRGHDTQTCPHRQVRGPDKPSQALALEGSGRLLRKLAEEETSARTRFT
ncbi:unnamed protein product [Pleuronectes platessa]|uniref:Uncharacterized protein n=1 Tax=Pleuronectes platessa TaxID=8262 RepID=A0A9N7Z035_PLEPL|nr:unnamed protein product [Pleuronectes platessa]